jgi:hypothetical protein
MKRILALTILSFSFLFAQAQQTKTPVFSKVTATWCPNCGSWGWDFMEEMKEMYNGGQEAVILGVHYSGNLRNPTAEWFSDNLKSLGQPVFFVNNEDLNATRNNWSSKIPEIQDKFEEISSEQPKQLFSFATTYINENNEIVANVTKSPSSFNSDEYYFGVYVFENNVEENQSPIGLSSHPNVLRGVMSDNFWGDLTDEISSDITTEYKMALDANWDANNVGLVAILWKKDGNDYIFENSAVIYNIGLLSSDFELIDEELIDIKSFSNQIEISIDTNDDYSVSLINPLGQLVDKQTFNRNISINTSSLVTGIYTVHISQGNQIISKQVFVNN